MRDIEIIIRGMAGSGKTTLAHIIQQALNERGLPCMIEDDSPPIDQMTLGLRLSGILRQRQVKTVKVRVQQAQRSWRPSDGE